MLNFQCSIEQSTLNIEHYVCLRFPPVSFFLSASNSEPRTQNSELLLPSRSAILLDREGLILLEDSEPGDM